jgi:hypothetical protein
MVHMVGGKAFSGGGVYIYVCVKGGRVMGCIILYHPSTTTKPRPPVNKVCVCNQTAAVSNRFRLIYRASSHMVSRFLRPAWFDPSAHTRSFFVIMCQKIDKRKKNKREEMYTHI